MKFQKSENFIIGKVQSADNESLRDENMLKSLESDFIEMKRGCK